VSARASSSRASPRKRPATSSFAVAFVAAALAIGGLAFADGGYDPPSWGWAALGLAAVAAVGLALRRVELSRLERIALGALAAFAAWAALSTVWSASVPLSVLDAQRLLVLPLALAAFLAVGGGLGLLEGVAAAATLASVWNLVTRVGAGEDVGERAQPLGYGNAVGILAGIGLLLALGLARERKGWLAACPALAAALVLSESRGAVAAVAAGALVAVALRSGRARLALPLVLAGAAVVLAAGGVAGSEERSAYWRVAADSALERPLLGSGSGTWVREWLAGRDAAIPARDAHGLYLETAAELGVVGLVLLCTAVLVPLVAAVRARELPQVPTAAAAYAAFVLHAGVDWDLELLAVALAGIACGAFLLAAEPARRARVPHAPALAVLAAAAVVAGVGLAGNVLVEAAAVALREGDAERAEARAATAVLLAPWSSEAWRLRGEAERELGRRDAAARSFRRGLERDAGDHELWLALARVEAGESRRRALERARRLNPLGVSSP
jgi:O-antigen ligase